MKFLPIIGFRIFSKKCGHLLDTRLAPHGLTSTKARVLAALAHHEALTPTDLLPWASVEPASMSLLLQAMEREGWIERKPHPTDKRAVLLSITETGREAHHRAFGVLEGTNEDIFGVLEDADREELHRILDVLMGRVKELSGGCHKGRHSAPSEG
jgi:DNA-binding MarR family transcriptional regulator